MPTCCLRAGCITGAAHAGVELHGFLNYLVKCALSGKTYTVYGYKGKQLRDNIHPLDIARFIEMFEGSPANGAVYNIGGGYGNTCSIVEAIRWIKELSGKQLETTYCEQHRKGDHICYYSDLSSLHHDFPDWDVSVSLSNIFCEIIDSYEDSTKEVPTE